MDANQALGSEDYLSQLVGAGAANSNALAPNGSLASVNTANKNLQNTLTQQTVAQQPAVQKFQQIAGQPMPQPPTPKQAGPAPDAQQFNKDAQGWVNSLAVFASLIGARGRSRGTGALKAYAAGLNGLKQGNQQAFDDSYKTWKANTDAMFKENDEEMAKYKAVLENRELSESEANQQMKMIGAEYQNKVMSDTHTADQAFAVYDSMVKARAGIDAYTAKMEAKVQESIKAQKIQKDAADAQYDDWKAQPQNVISADAYAKNPSLTPLVRGRGAQAEQEVENIKKLAAERHPDMDIAGAGIKYAGDVAGSRAVGTASGKISLAANSLDQSLPLLEDAIKKVDLTKFSDLNSLENYARSHTGDPNITTLNTALQTTVTDYSTLIARNGQRTDATDTAAKNLANTSMSQGQLGAFIAQVRKEKDAQLRATAMTKNGNAGEPSADNAGDGWKIEPVQ